MRVIGSRAISAVVALAIAASPTAGLAAAPPAAAAPQARDPWVTLSMLTPAGATVLGGSAAAVAQPETPPPPPPAVEERRFHVPLPVIAIWLADIALMIYIATRGDDDDNEVGVSPT